MDPTQALLAALVAVVLGWFALGVVFNLRRGNAVLKWLQGGLPRLGERTTLRWLGSSAVALEIAKARPPFRRVELVLVLEPRDVPWFWMLSRWRGRRDLLILRGQLVSAPQQEFVWSTPGSWSERERRRDGRDWPGEQVDGLRLQAPAGSLAAGRPAARAALAAARLLHPTIWQLAARRGQPHLELHLPLPNPRQADADAARFCDQLRQLAEQLSRRD